MSVFVACAFLELLFTLVFWLSCKITKRISYFGLGLIPFVNSVLTLMCLLAILTAKEITMNIYIVLATLAILASLFLYDSILQE